ncbi:MAG: FliH/SctL family protein [Pseudomonadota bacterium]
MTSSDAPSLASGWRPPSLDRKIASAQSAPPDHSALAAEAEQRGYEEGLAKGLAEGKAEVEAQAVQLATLIRALEAPFEDSDPALLRALLELTETLTRALLDRELSADRDALEAVLSEALLTLADVKQPLVVTLNPEDARLCAEFSCFDGRDVTVRHNQSMQRGGVIVESGSQFIDASLEARLRRQVDALYKHAGLPEPEPENSSFAPQAALDSEPEG